MIRTQKRKNKYKNCTCLGCRADWEREDKWNENGTIVRTYVELEKEIKQSPSSINESTVEYEIWNTGNEGKKVKWIKTELISRM